MQWFGGVLMLLVGVALCVWTVISPGITWDADGLHLVPRFLLGAGFVIAGIVAIVRARRRRGGGPDQG
jgi:hypothetical protein